MPLFIIKITDEEKIMSRTSQKASILEHKIGPKTSTRGARPLLKLSKRLSGIRRSPPNVDKYLRTSGTPPKQQTQTPGLKNAEKCAKILIT